MVHACWKCLNSNDEQPLGSLRVRLILAPLGIPRCQDEFDPQWNSIECSPFKPSHYLQSCIENLLNMKGVVCKTTNFWPKVKFRRITLLCKHQRRLSSLWTPFSIPVVYCWCDLLRLLHWHRARSCRSGRFPSVRASFQSSLCYWWPCKHFFMNLVPIVSYMFILKLWEFMSNAMGVLE